MLEVHQWLLKKQEQQSLEAIFRDAWYSTFQCHCISNKVDIDARCYTVRHSIPDYVLSFYVRERRCTVH